MDPIEHPTPLERLKDLQRAVRVSEGRKPTMEELCVLSPAKDPFHSGTKTDEAQAVWFWELFGDTRGSHLRRLHYRLVSRGDVLKPDGRVYQNDNLNWEYLQAASRQARYLGLISPEHLVDRRNPAPHIHMEAPFGFEPDWTYDLKTARLTRVSTYLGNSDYFPLLGVETEVTGYLYEESQQPYLVEIWSEKSTINDILVPLCSSLGANYVSGAGYMSITTMIALLRRRVARLQKPTRILYVSDYDSAGRNMPRQVARQLQFWIDRYASDYDIRVQPIAMTSEQAQNYPAAPDSGSVELDAMQELDPGLLAEIVTENVSQFRDFELEQATAEAEEEAESLVADGAREAIAPELEAVEQIKREAEEIYQGYRARLEELASELNGELAPLDRRVENLQRAAREKLDALEPDLPELPEGETEEDPEDEDWLFDSSRPYLEQQQIYRERR
jgi:polyhydroxyalkanoate synthesis regulator phasin